MTLVSSTVFGNRVSGGIAGRKGVRGDGGPGGLGGIGGNGALPVLNGSNGPAGMPGSAGSDGLSDGLPGDALGGGIVVSTPAVNVKNTIIAGNTFVGTGSSPDVSGAFMDNGHNLIGDGTGSSSFVNGTNGDQVGASGAPINPMLGLLGDNGGPTPTQLPQPGSPVIDNGDNAGAPVTDQRGLPRVVDGTGIATAIIDIGAVEYQPPDVSITGNLTPTAVMPGNNVTLTLVVTSSGDNPPLNVNVSVPLPAHMNFQSFLVPLGWSTSTPAVGSGGTVTAFTSSIAPGSTANLTLLLQVNSSTPGGMRLTETATLTTQSPDPTSTDNSVTGTIIVAARDDIVGRVGSTGQWWVGLSNGSSAFTNSLATTWSTAVTWVDVLSGDFNGDGVTDIAGRVLETGQWWVALSDGSGGFTNSLWDTWSTGVTWVDVKVGDFNGDGKMDIVGRARESGQWWIAQSTGSSFVNHLWGSWSTAATWVDIQVADFNNDGKADITGRYLQGGSWWTSLSTGSNFTTSPWATWSTGVTWMDVQVGDFNGDGKSDIIGRARETGQWWAGISTGSTFTNSLWTTWSTAVTWVDVQVGDFNGDGKSDIIGRALEIGQWWTGLSNGTAFTTSLWTTWSTAVTWVDVHAGDFA
jgi:uncharacterized repeat protein (TIGR01451 family)